MVLLPSGGVMELRHAHADKNKPHHQGIVSDSTNHHKAQRRRGPHSHNLAHNDNRIESRASHVHVSWLVFEFTAPCPADSTPARGGEQDGGQTQFVQPTGELALSTGRPTPPAAPLAEQIVHSSAAILQPASSNFSVTPALSAPLSDTARHERSGVQLI